MRIQKPSPKYLSKSEIRGPKSTIESIVKTLKAEKFEESNIELFEAVYEAAERVDEEADEIIVEKLSLIRLLRLLLIKLPEARQLMIILPENESNWLYGRPWIE